MRDEHLGSAVYCKLHGDDGLDHNVLNALHQLDCIDVVRLQMFEKCTERPFVALVVDIWVGALDIVRVAFVD